MKIACSKDTIKNHILKLSPLKSFNADLLLPNGQYDKKLCEFIIALSLVWNDIKSVHLYLDHMQNISKEFIKKHGALNKYTGESLGILNFILKINIGIIYELMNLIRESEKTINSDSFKKICDKLDHIYLENWNVLVDCAFKRYSKDNPLKKMLKNIRNRITNHYDKKKIFYAYEKRFKTDIKKNKNSEPIPEDLPYISKGNSMAETRLFYADATVEKYVEIEAKQSKINILDELNMINNLINPAIQALVITFIESRGKITESK